jgi:heme/copper-type cytochrome/quinol oxidase subunit 2
MVVLMRKSLRADVMLGAAVVICLLAPGSVHGRAQPSETSVMEIDAERFSFTPSELRVPARTTVELRIRSHDTNHGFRIIGTDINAIVPKRGRGTATVMFRPEKPGRYVFECSKLCGAGHSFMRGVIVVSE